MVLMNIGLVKSIRNISLYLLEVRGSLDATPLELDIVLVIVIVVVVANVLTFPTFHTFLTFRYSYHYGHSLPFLTFPSFKTARDCGSRNV